VICAAWGPRSDWYRNLRAGPAVKVDFGRAFTPVHRFITDEEAWQRPDGIPKDGQTACHVA